MGRDSELGRQRVVGVTFPGVGSIQAATVSKGMGESIHFLSSPKSERLVSETETALFMRSAKEKAPEISKWSMDTSEPADEGPPRMDPDAFRRGERAFVMR